VCGGNHDVWRKYRNGGATKSYYREGNEGESVSNTPAGPLTTASGPAMGQRPCESGTVTASLQLKTHQASNIFMLVLMLDSMPLRGDYLVCSLV
jgi:hypothetical protein